MPVLPNDPLATQLNDLAVANSDGLLNDDEYRLLRQNLFERYSGGVEILSVSASPILKPVSAPRRKHVELVEQPAPRAQVAPSLSPSRSKISGVADLLRRATGRKSTPPSPSPSRSPTPIILSLIPRMFSRKQDDALSSDTESSSGTRHSSSQSFSRKRSNGDLDPRPKPQGLVSSAPPNTRPRAEPTSPIRSNFDTVPKSPSRSAFDNAPPSKFDVIPGGSNDIFDDDNLQTSEAIRKAIAAVEAEGRRLITAFNDLETSAVIRYRREHPQRQRLGTTPSSIPRHPTLSPLPSPSGSHTPNRSRSNSHRTLSPTAETQSVRSNSSLRTAKSVASFLQSSSPPPAFSQSTPPPTSPPPTSPSSWGAKLPSLRRKTSASSISSQGTPPGSFLSAGRAAGAGSSSLSRSSSMSRSTGHLPLPVPVQRQGSGSTMMELLNHGAAPPAEEGGEELAEVRRRRAEMVGRCEARLEYLRAKLKGAQIHEKLLKK